MRLVKKPCRECPFRKDSWKGYLGDVSGQPEVYLEQLEHSTPIPCHLTVDWESPDYLEEVKQAPACIGALQFMNNSCKLSKFKNIIELQEEAGKNDQIFKWSPEFIKHHKGDLT